MAIYWMPDIGDIEAAAFFSVKLACAKAPAFGQVIPSGQSLVEFREELFYGP